MLSCDITSRKAGCPRSINISAQFSNDTFNYGEVMVTSELASEALFMSTPQIYCKLDISEH